MTTPATLAAGTRALYRCANGYVDRDLVIRRSARDRFCDGWDHDCEAEIHKGDLYAANRHGVAHYCLNCVEVLA